MDTSLLSLNLSLFGSGFFVKLLCYWCSVLIQRRSRNGKCRAELSTDAPVAMAIGACILNSLIFPAAPSQEDMEAESLIDSADARFAVMGIISFIPYFNWMVIFFSFFRSSLHFGIFGYWFFRFLVAGIGVELGVCLVGYGKAAVCCLCYCLFSPLLEVWISFSFFFVLELCLVCSWLISKVVASWKWWMNWAREVCLSLIQGGWHSVAELWAFPAFVILICFLMRITSWNLVYSTSIYEWFPLVKFNLEISLKFECCQFWLFKVYLAFELLIHAWKMCDLWGVKIAKKNISPPAQLISYDDSL